MLRTSARNHIVTFTSSSIYYTTESVVTHIARFMS